MLGFLIVYGAVRHLVSPPQASGGAAENEWKSVGDVAYVDDEGYVFICDRKKDMIISGGVNIYPAEIEAVLYAHPQVLEALISTAAKGTSFGAPTAGEIDLAAEIARRVDSVDMA